MATKNISLKDKFRGREDIGVYNWGSSVVCIHTKNDDYSVEAEKDGQPGFVSLMWSEVEWVVGKSNAFQAGLLEFDPNEADELYTALKIDKTKIIFMKDIEDIIVNPDIEKMQRLIDTTNAQIIERIRGVLVKMVNEGKDISNKTIDIINARAHELRRGQHKSRIIITPAEKFVPASSDEVDNLKNQIAELKQMIELSQKS